jgi:hypothetical protein
VKKGFQVITARRQQKNMFEATQIRFAKSKKLRMVTALV